jgi:hypothetical protein
VRLRTLQLRSIALFNVNRRRDTQHQPRPIRFCYRGVWKGKKLDAEYTSGEQMEALGKETISQKPETVERLRKVLGK